MEVLEQGRTPATGRGPAPWWRALALAGVAVALIATAGLAGARWWAEQEARPDRLEILAATVLGQAGARLGDGEAGWPGGLGTPDGSTSPAVRLRLTVAGDPQRDERLRAALPGTDVAVVDFSDMTVPAGGESVTDIVVAPTDCSASDGRPIPLLVRADGSDVAMSDPARSAVTNALASLCAAAGPPPSLDVRGALVDVFFRDRTLVVTAGLASGADRVVLTPLDGTALRGLGAQDVPAGAATGTVRLRWLISPGEMSPHTSLTGRVQAYAVIGGVAYPWVMTVQPPRDLDAPRPRTPLRNDGVDLAEVAPGPALNAADVQTQ